MTRKRTVASATLLILGAGGLAFAASEQGTPLQKIAEAVTRVEGNTLAIEDQAGAITQQTTTVVQQNATISQQTASLLKSSSALDQKLDVVLAALAKIEVPPQQPPPAAAPSAHRVWVAPKFEYRDNWDRTLQYRSTVTVMNPGAEPATVYCRLLRDGAEHVEHRTRITLEAGSVGGCYINPEASEFRSTWLLISSDQPVLPTGETVHSRKEASSTVSVTAENLVVYPVDCTGDWVGVEAVCDAVASFDPKK